MDKNTWHRSVPAKISGTHSFFGYFPRSSTIILPSEISGTSWVKEVTYSWLGQRMHDIRRMSGETGFNTNGHYNRQKPPRPSSSKNHNEKTKRGHKKWSPEGRIVPQIDQCTHIPGSVFGQQRLFMNLKDQSNRMSFSEETNKVPHFPHIHKLNKHINIICGTEKDNDHAVSYMRRELSIGQGIQRRFLPPLGRRPEIAYGRYQREWQRACRLGPLNCSHLGPSIALILESPPNEVSREASAVTAFRTGNCQSADSRSKSSRWPTRKSSRRCSCEGQLPRPSAPFRSFQIMTRADTSRLIAESYSTC